MQKLLAGFRFKPKVEFEFNSIIQYVIVFFFVGILGNITFSLVTTDRGIWESLVAFRPGCLFLALVLALAPWVTDTIRLYIWTRFLGRQYKLSDLLKITISTDVGAAVSPAAIGGGYVKTGMLMKRGMSAGTATSLMTVGSVEDGVFFAIAIPIATILSSFWEMPLFSDLVNNFNIVNLLPFIVLFLLLFAILFTVLKFSWFEKFTIVKKLESNYRKAVSDFVSVYKMIGKTGKTRFALTFFLAAIKWMCRYSVITAMLMSFNIPVNPILSFLFQWITFTVMTFIPTPGAAAGAEASFYLIYTSLIPKEFLGIMTSGWRFLTFYFQITLGILILGGYYILQLQQKS